VLLADALMRRGVQGTYATTIVSSSLLRRLCAARDVPYAETLTGFKWLGRVDGLAFAYEEALGYCVAPSIARDKDGISALVLALELAAGLAAAGLTLQDRLDELAREHGVHATDQLAVRVEDLAVIGAALRRLRDAPPATLGGVAVESFHDLADGAGVLWDIDEFANAVGPQGAGAKVEHDAPDAPPLPVGLPATEEAVLSGVGFEATGVDAVARRVGIAMRDVLPALALLELKGFVTRDAVGAYARRAAP
jgi:phosphomannomutase